MYIKYKRLVCTQPDLWARFCKVNLSNVKIRAAIISFVQILVFIQKMQKDGPEVFVTDTLRFKIYVRKLNRKYWIFRLSNAKRLKQKNMSRMSIRHWKQRDILIITKTWKAKDDAKVSLFVTIACLHYQTIMSDRCLKTNLIYCKMCQNITFEY